MALSSQVPVIRKTDADMHDERVERLKSALRAGAHPETAAAYAGITGPTLKRWVETGRSLIAIQEAVLEDPDDDREPSVAEFEYIMIAEAYDKAQAQAETRLVEVVGNAADAGDWRAAMALLERRFKERWSRRSEVTGADGGPLQIEDPATRRATLQAGIDKMAEQIREQERALEMERAERAEVVSIERDAG